MPELRHKVWGISLDINMRVSFDRPSVVLFHHPVIGFSNIEVEAIIWILHVIFAKQNCIVCILVYRNIQLSQYIIDFAGGGCWWGRVEGFFCREETTRVLKSQRLCSFQSISFCPFRYASYIKTYLLPVAIHILHFCFLSFWTQYCRLYLLITCFSYWYTQEDLED